MQKKMQKIVDAAPAVFERGSMVFAPVVPILESQVKPLLVGKYDMVFMYLMALFCGTGIIKLLNPAPMKKLWKWLPGWSWSVAALVEFGSSYLFHQGQLDVAIPLYYTFLGAVTFACITQMSTITITPFPLSTVALVWCYGQEFGVDSSSWVVPCMVTGAFCASFVGGMKGDSK